MSNNFRDEQMRKAYDTMCEMFHTRSPHLFDQPFGSSSKEFFWKGFHDIVPYWDQQSKNTLMYACWRAGQDCAIDAQTGNNPLFKETVNED